MTVHPAPTASSPSPAEAARATLGQYLDPQIPVALLDYPDHSNVGDSAIWAGEEKYLRDARFDVRYVCDLGNFNETALRQRMPFGQILLHGGGNFGTIWPRYQAFREMVVQRFPEFRIVQLPQSIHFSDERSLARTQRCLSAHRDFTLLVRDRESLGVAQRDLGVHAALCPDSALLLEGSLPRATPEVDVLVLARTDKEQRGAGLGDFTLAGRSVRTADWLDEPGTAWRSATQWAKAGAQGALGGTAAWQRVQRKCFAALADERIARGAAQLAQGRVVVTDRLHAHILCMLMGIPHVVLDNAYGKLGRFIQCWHDGHPLVSLVSDAALAPAAAQRLLERA
jgi:exopolysaccharide biosynthesis predicted pyruvyltransferase EpsI